MGLGSQQLGRADVGLLTNLQDLPTDESGRRRPHQDYQCHQHRKDTAFAGSDAERDLEENHEQQERQRDHEVREAHQDLIYSSTDEARSAPVENADEDEEQRRDDTDE